MAPPAKTSRNAIIADALALVNEQGRSALTIRSLARRLSLAPNAIYSYFGSFDDLLIALAIEGWRQLLEALNAVRSRFAGVAAVRRVSIAYVRFAVDHPALYEMMILPYPESEERTKVRAGFDDLNAAVYGPLLPAGLSLHAPYMVWSALHGMIHLHRSGMLPHVDLESYASRSVVALIRGLQRS